MRVLLFINHHLTSSMLLAAAVMVASATRSNIEVIAIVDAARDRLGRARLPRELILRAGRRLSDPLHPAPFFQTPLFITPALLARRHRVPLLVAPDRQLNHPGFVEQVAALRPDASLVLMVDQIFRPPLLGVCGEGVNYHNAPLPAYRGIGANEWCIYLGEPHSGYAFHRMVEGLDAGPILAQGEIPISPGASSDAVERAKTEHARAEIGHVLDLMAGGEPGTAQEGETGMYTLNQLNAVRDVGDTSTHTHDELRRRLRAFGLLTVTGERERIAGVTALRPARGASELVSADGVALEPSRVLHMSPPLFRLYRSAGVF